MSKNGILIFITTIIILLIIAFICIFKGNNTSGGKVEKLYNKISENKTYTFFMEEANNNYKYKILISQKQDDVCIDMHVGEEHTTTITLEDKSYYLIHDEKEYYYANEKADDADIVIYGLKNIINGEYKAGTEKINGKEYHYEEYNNENGDFIIYANINEESQVTTKFYFDNNKLSYIKNIIVNGEEQDEELLKVDIKYEVDDNVFKIPEDYAEVEQ